MATKFAKDVNNERIEKGELTINGNQVIEKELDGQTKMYSRKGIYNVGDDAIIWEESKTESKFDYKNLCWEYKNSVTCNARVWTRPGN